MQFKSFFKIFINENWTKRVSSKDFRKILTKYANVPDAMYSFRSYINKSAGVQVQKINPMIGINPKNSYSTPTGIYGYPVEETLDKALLNILEFASDRPILVVYKPKKNAFVVRASTFSEEQLREKKFLLADLLNSSFEQIQEIANLNIVSAYKKNPAQEIWSLTRLLSKQKVNAWAKLLIDIGCPIFIDDIGSGFIHPSEPIQCVVFGRQFVEIVDVVENLKLTPETNEKDDTLKNLYIQINKIQNSPIYREGDVELLEKYSRRKNALLMNLQPFIIEQKLNLWEWIYTSTSLPVENLKVEKTALSLETTNRPEILKIINKIIIISGRDYSPSISPEFFQREGLFLDFLLESLDLNNKIKNLIFLLEKVGFDLRLVKRPSNREKFQKIIKDNKTKILNYLENYFEENSDLNIETEIGKLLFIMNNNSMDSESVFQILSKMKPGDMDFVSYVLKSLSTTLDFLSSENKNWKIDLEKENKKVYNRIKLLIEKYSDVNVKSYFHATHLSSNQMCEKIFDEDDSGVSTRMNFMKKMLIEFPFNSQSSVILFNLLALDNSLNQHSKESGSVLDGTDLGNILTQKLIDENLTNHITELIGKGFMEMYSYWREKGGRLPRIITEFDNTGIFNDDELKNFLTTENLKELINHLYINSDWFEGLSHNYNTKGETYAEKLIYSLENNLYSWANPMIENHMGNNLFTKKFITKLMLNNKEKILENVKDSDFTNGYELKI
jgi:hypothetical protein